MAATTAPAPIGRSPGVVRAWRVLALVGVLAIAAVMLLPLVWMVATSFKPETDIVKFPPALLPETPPVVQQAVPDRGGP